MLGARKTVIEWKRKEEEDINCLDKLLAQRREGVKMLAGVGQGLKRDAQRLRQWQRVAQERDAQVQREMTELRAQLDRSQGKAAVLEDEALTAAQRKDARSAELEAACRRLEAQAAAGSHVAAGASGSNASPQVLADCAYPWFLPERLPSRCC